MADKQSRKYNVTINNPTDKGLDHDTIKRILEQFKSCVYWCMADEIGLDTQTPHTHIYIQLKSSTRFSRIKKLLPEAHIESAQGTRTDISELYSKIENGMSNAEVMAENPDSARYIHLMDKIRQDILEARYREQWRNLDVTYIFGPTGTGKTRGVMEKHGYGNVYRVTDYNHPFDRYNQEPVICFDEFRSSFMVGDMLDYLDGYPLALPAPLSP